MADEDTEITLGAGKLLGLFFMLAAVCGIFFAVGFSLGKTSAKEEALQQRATEARTPAAGLAEPAGSKPAAGEAGTAEAASSGSESAKQPEPDLTFYKAVKQNGQEATEPPASNAKTSVTEAVPSQQAGSNKNSAGTRPAVEPGAESPSSRSVPPTAISGPNSPAASPGGTFLVQIAAVSHEEDAAALAGALRKKSYAAAVINSPSGKDKLFHVVLGPYASLQDAEAMKIKLQGEGYNPIVKR